MKKLSPAGQVETLLGIAAQAKFDRPKGIIKMDAWESNFCALEIIQYNQVITELI